MDLCGDNVVIVGVHFCGEKNVEVEAVYEGDLAFEEG